MDASNAYGLKPTYRPYPRPDHRNGNDHESDRTRRATSRAGDENKLIAQRREKLDQLRTQGNAFPNDFRRDGLAADLHACYGELSAEDLEAQGVRVSLGGRLMSRRIMGKASFSHLQDMCGRIQLFVQRDTVGEETYAAYKKDFDLGDIVGAEGVLFKTKTGELSLRCETLRLLTKALRPLPEKWHGLTDQETPLPPALSRPHYQRGRPAHLPDPHRA